MTRVFVSQAYCSTLKKRTCRKKTPKTPTSSNRQIMQYATEPETVERTHFGVLTAFIITAGMVGRGHLGIRA